MTRHNLRTRTNYVTQTIQTVVESRSDLILTLAGGLGELQERSGTNDSGRVVSVVLSVENQGPVSGLDWGGVDGLTHRITHRFKDGFTT